MFPVFFCVRPQAAAAKNQREYSKTGKQTAQKKKKEQRGRFAFYVLYRPVFFAWGAQKHQEVGR
jgi:hypothetical protein